MKKCRDSLEIIYSMLCKIAENEGINKTHIMYDSRLSYEQLKRYLERLKELKLIFHDTHGYYINDKGKEFIKRFSGVIDIIAK